MYRDNVLSLLKSYKSDYFDKYGIEELGIFGSVARGQETSISDVDICIKTKTADMFAIVHIKEDLQNILAKRVDIVRIRDKMNPFLKNRIEKEAIYV
jgi:predicted nucleotidyltransferase